MKMTLTKLNMPLNKESKPMNIIYTHTVTYSILVTYTQSNSHQIHWKRSSGRLLTINPGSKRVRPLLPNLCELEHRGGIAWNGTVEKKHAVWSVGKKRHNHMLGKEQWRGGPREHNFLSYPYRVFTLTIALQISFPHISLELYYIILLVECRWN